MRFALAGSDSGPRIYEGLQPPLYYWLLSVPYRLIASAPLLDRVYFLRYLSLAIASLVIPLTFLVASRTTGSARGAIGVSALVAVMPGLMINVCRVGNECLGIVIYSWLILLTLDLVSDANSRKSAALIGLALGLGLLTKAYFLTAILAIGLLLLIRKSILNALSTCSIALAVAGWWYLRNRITTGAWSGLSESVILRDTTWQEMLAGVMNVRWAAAIDSILLSHIWFGAWSSLQVRSWMYHLLYLVILAAFIGVAATVARKKLPLLWPLLAMYGFFWVGQLYNVLLLFLSKGASTSMGWYLYAVIAAESTLLAAGLQRGLPLLVLALGALDLYTVHFLCIPYYTGLIAHQPNGPVTAFHLTQLSQTGLPEILHRLSTNKPPWLTATTLGLLWAGYAAATTALLTSAPLREPDDERT